VSAENGSDRYDRDVRKLQYAVAGDLAKPFRLARLSWPDVAEYVSSTQATWTTDRKLFDWLYTSDGTWIEPDDAARIAASWGVSL